MAHHRVLSADAHTIDGLHDDKHEEKAVDGGAIRDRQQHSACMQPAIKLPQNTADALFREAQLIDKMLAHQYRLLLLAQGKQAAWNKYQQRDATCQCRPANGE